MSRKLDLVMIISKSWDKILYFAAILHFAVFVLTGAGPHPKAFSGRLISAIWWLFTILLLACYFSNLNSMLHSNNKHVSIKTFEDLADQDLIDYGTVESGSTMMFFKAYSVAHNLTYSSDCACFLYLSWRQKYLSFSMKTFKCLIFHYFPS